MIETIAKIAIFLLGSLLMFMLGTVLFLEVNAIRANKKLKSQEEEMENLH